MQPKILLLLLLAHPGRILLAERIDDPKLVFSPSVLRLFGKIPPE
jgi:hypothetical protein